MHFSTKLQICETRHTQLSRCGHPEAYNFRMSDLLSPLAFLDAAPVSALRAWYAGVGSREAIERYYSQALEGGHSARGVIGGIRRQLVGFALSRHRADLAQLFQCAAGERTRHRKAATRALDILPSLPVPQPRVSDAIDAWLPPRVVLVLHRHGIRTLADLTVRIPRRRRWWLTIPGLGMRSARHIEAFFAARPELTERARTDRGGDTGTRNAMGRYPRAAQRRRLTRGLPRAEADVCARGR